MTVTKKRFPTSIDMIDEMERRVPKPKDFATPREVLKNEAFKIVQANNPSIFDDVDEYVQVISSLCIEYSFYEPVIRSAASSITDYGTTAQGWLLVGDTQYKIAYRTDVERAETGDIGGNSYYERYLKVQYRQTPTCDCDCGKEEEVIDNHMFSTHPVITQDILKRYYEKHMRKKGK